MYAIPFCQMYCNIKNVHLIGDGNLLYAETTKKYFA